MSNGTRTLDLLALLQSRRYWRGTDLANRLEVSVRTLRRDVDQLRDLGYPVEARRGVDGGYQLAAGAALPPLVVDDEEAVALAVGLQAAVQAGIVAGIEESSVRALAKIVQVMPRRLRHRVDALAAMTVPATPGTTAPSVDSGVLTSIAQACRDSERLEFSYTARTGEATDRLVDPHRLVLLGRRWYLVAWDLTRFDWRTFRLDRLDGPKGTGAHSPPRQLPGGDAAQFVRDGIDNLPTRHRVEVVVHAPASVVRDRIGPWGDLEVVDDDRCLLRMTADSLDWPMMALGAAGADFEVVAPEALVDHLRQRVDRFGRAVERAQSEKSGLASRARSDRPLGSSHSS
jgi:predicted DNA-binding transcriptional regulator YafY